MKGVIFDTSIWIEYLRGNDEFFEICQELLENGRVYGLELIFAEMLQGAKGKKEVDTIMSFVSLIPTLDEPFLIIESGLISQKDKFVNYGVGLIDAVIIQSARKNSLQIWTLDKKLRKISGYDLMFKP